MNLLRGDASKQRHATASGAKPDWQQFGIKHLGWARYEELRDTHIQSHIRAAVRRGYQSTPDLIQP